MLVKYVSGYPVFYVNRINECLCSECAEENRNNYIEYEDNYNNERNPIDQHVNWENKALYCDKCSVQIEPSYQIGEESNEHN